MTKERIYELIEQHTIITDEWGGSKLANWKYGHHVCVGGIDEAADAILAELPEMRWTTKVPTESGESGFYLIKDEHGEIEVAELVFYDGALRYNLNGSYKTMLLFTKWYKVWCKIPEPLPEKEE